MQNASAGASSSALRIAAVLLAAVLHVAVGWFTLASGLLAPLWAVVVLSVVWLVATAALVRVARRRPLAAPLVPVVNALLWWAALTVGEVALNWTA